MSIGDYARLRLGLIPEEIEDEWFVYMENDCLFLHRSWTGFCIYTVRFEKVGDRWVASEIWANRDTKQYPNQDAAEDISMLIGILRNLLEIG